MNSVLVTGGAGFIGSVLVHEFLEQGIEVGCIDKGYFGFDALERIKNNITLKPIDIADVEIDFLKKYEVVCHLAGFSNDPQADYSPRGNDLVNRQSAIEFADKCCQAGVTRFIFASSASVYGFSDDRGTLTEESETDPQSHYAESKLKAEEGILKFKDDMQIVILRKATVMGCSPRQRYDLVVNTFMKDAFLKGVINVYGGGESWRPLVNVLDVAKAYISIAERFPFTEGIYNLVHKNYRISELAHWVHHCIKLFDDSIANEIFINFDYDKPKDTRSYRLSGEKIKKELSIECNIGVQETVQTFLMNFKNEDGIDFDNPKYYNIRWIKEICVPLTKIMGNNTNVFQEFTEYNG